MTTAFDNDLDGTSLAPIFSEPKITLDDLPPIPDPDLFEDETTSERLKAIIRHMRKVSGRREMSALIEFLPLPNGGKQFVITFPEGDERAVCRMWAEEVRREGVEDPAVAERLNAAHEQVKRAQKVVEAAEHTAMQVGAFCGDIIEAFDQLRAANDAPNTLNVENIVEVWSVVQELHERLSSPSLTPFLQFVAVCVAERKRREAERELEQISHKQADGRTKRRKDGRSTVASHVVEESGVEDEVSNDDR